MLFQIAFDTIAIKKKRKAYSHLLAQRWLCHFFQEPPEELGFKSLFGIHLFLNDGSPLQAL